MSKHPEPLPARQAGRANYTLEQYEELLTWNPAKLIPKEPNAVEEELVRALHRSIRDAAEDASMWLSALRKRDSIAEDDPRRRALAEIPELEEEDRLRLHRLSIALEAHYRSWSPFIAWIDQRSHRTKVRPH